MEFAEKVVESEEIYEGRIITLRKDTVELPGGGVATREIVMHPGGVGIVAVDEQDNILFVRQFRHGAGRELLEIPAGKLNHGEDPEQCGIRELEEETGMKPGVFIPLGGIFPSPAYLGEITYIYYAGALSAGRQQLDKDEFLSVERIHYEKAADMLLGGGIFDAKTQAGVLKYKLMRDKGLI